MPDFSYEHQKIDAGYRTVIGVDEVGRGPWAGPVVAAAALLNPLDIPEGLRDSKKLSSKKREVLYDIIMEKATVSIAEASVAEIDTLNIREATFLAMKRAVMGLNMQVDYIFVDGNALPKELPAPAEAIIKGDDHVLSIACASIVAKVYRDRLMADLAKAHPHYAWEKNAGYGTKAHQEGLAKAGVTKHHRRSFKPIQVMVD